MLCYAVLRPFTPLRSLRCDTRERATYPHESLKGLFTTDNMRRIIMRTVHSAICGVGVGSVYLVKQPTHRDRTVGVDSGGCIIAHRVSVNADVIA